MNNKIEYADQIAQLVIDKSYLGNDYFVLYALLLVAIVAGITGAYSGQVDHRFWKMLISDSGLS